jgi:valyl-tRNA synthetase
MAETFYITTAIDYTNSPPHVGHAYEKVLADVIARYHRLKGQPVFFLTGVDQHGQKVQQSAAKAGVPPAEFVKATTQKFVDLWKKLDVRYDEWAETTSDRHKKVVQGILQRLFEAGQIYKDKQSGYYSVRQEQFLTDKERGADGQFGPEWGEIEFREEETSSSVSTKTGCFITSINEQTQSFPIFARRNCETQLRESAAISASPVRNHDLIGGSSYRSTKTLSLTSGSTR